MGRRSAITTHVLDTATGVPAAGVGVILARRDERGEWLEIGQSTTDTDGRVTDFRAGTQLSVGTYRLTFATGEYFKRRQVDSFYPQVEIVFEVRDSAGHYHVPLLLSPYGYSTYRGS